MPHDRGVATLIIVIPFHPVSQLYTKQASEKENSSKHEMTLNQLFDPSFELFLALNIQASIKIVIHTMR